MIEWNDSLQNVDAWANGKTENRLGQMGKWLGQMGKNGLVKWGKTAWSNGKNGLVEWGKGKTAWSNGTKTSGQGKWEDGELSFVGHLICATHRYVADVNN